MLPEKFTILVRTIPKYKLTVNSNAMPPCISVTVNPNDSNTPCLVPGVCGDEHDAIDGSIVDS